MTPPTARVDHLVIVAATLDEGAAWCEATLGVAPGPGGEHPLMGTHNRLLRIATVDYPRAYLEIIAVNPAAPAPVPPRAGRWFDMDNPVLARAIRAEGPRLVHYAANVPNMEQALAPLAARGIDRGPALAASRMTPRGLLQWRITVREDGQRLYDGTLPTLIEWGDVHPAGSLPDCGLALRSLAVSHPKAVELRAIHGDLGLTGVAVAEGPANLTAVLATPRGNVILESKGL